MKILFVTHPYPNYVPDLLLHGLRKLFGPGVVDYPRKDCLYEGVLGLGVCPDDQRCPGWFPDDGGLVDRSDIPAKLAADYFEIVLCDVRAFSTLAKLVRKPPARTAIIDGEDKPALIKPGPYVIFRRETDGGDFSIPLPMAMPEEILAWIGRFDDLPKRFSIGFLGSTHDGERRRMVEILAQHFPDCLFAATAVPNNADPAPQGRMGRDRYYRHLQQCRIVLSLAGAGFDTFRFWENAACNAVHACVRMPLWLPDEFSDGIHLIRFSRIEELLPAAERILSSSVDSRSMAIRSREHIKRFHLTTARAEYVIKQVYKAYGNQ